MSLPATVDDLDLIKLATEVAVNYRKIDDILAHHAITWETWAEIKDLPRFQQLLQAAVEDWNLAANVQERVKLRASYQVEQALPEMWRRLHDLKEPLSAKVELLKTLARFGDVGVQGSNVEGGGERVNITINLGASEKIKIEKENTRIIEGVILDNGKNELRQA